MIPSHKTGFGKQGELYVTERLRGLGFAVEHVGNTSHYNILCNGRTVEVKSAFVGPGARGWGWAWQFAFNRNGIRNNFCLVCLNCYDDPLKDPLGTFVIPGPLVRPALTKISITRRDPAKYGGQWSPHWEAWGDVAGIVAGCETRDGEGAEEVEVEIPF